MRALFEILLARESAQTLGCHRNRGCVDLSLPDLNCPTRAQLNIAGQMTGVPWDEAASHLIRDRDEAFGSAYTQRIRQMEIFPAQNLLRDVNPFFINLSKL
jgi:hypothetical protein